MAQELRKVTGYQLREALKSWELRKTTAAKQFEQSLWVFAGEDKPPADELATAFSRAEEAIARLQTVQAEYNLQVQVEVQGQSMTLSEAVKMVGGAGRLEKMWRSAATPQEQYGYNPMMMVRQKDQEHARRSVDVNTAVVRTESAARRAAALRNAIAVGNAVEREMTLDSELLL